MRRLSVGLVEPDHEIGTAVLQDLSSQGIATSHVPSLLALQREMRDHRFDVVVLGPSLNGSGVDLCTTFRSTNDDLIFVLGSADDDPDHVVALLKAGADAHLAYPLDSRELAARLQALARRKPRHDLVMQSGQIAIRLLSQQVTKNGQPIDLSKIEFRLLLVLMRSMGRPLDRAELVRDVWGYEYLGRSRLVDMGIKRLRDKIEDDPSHPRYIITIKGGYLFAPFGRAGSGELGIASGPRGGCEPG